MKIEDIRRGGAAISLSFLVYLGRKMGGVARAGIPIPLPWEYALKDSYFSAVGICPEGFLFLCRGDMP